MTPPRARSRAVTAAPARLHTIQPPLRHFFASVFIDRVIAILIFASVVLTLAELSLEETARTRPTISSINLAINLVFVAEMALRYVAEWHGKGSAHTFVRRWWIDLVAITPALFPLLESFRIFRGLRILKFLRLVRVGRLFSRVGGTLPYLARRGSIHLALVGFVLVSTVAMSTALVLSFERRSNPDIDGFGDAFWFSLYSLFAGEPVPGPAATNEGRIVSVLVMFMGFLVFAVMIGTVSALMIERLQKEGSSRMKAHYMDDHVILCGLGHVGSRTLQSLQALGQQVVVVERAEDCQFLEEARSSKVPVVVEDARKSGLLVELGLEHARAVIACTNDDLTNLEIALDARSKRPDVRVVLRLFDARLAQKVTEGFNIQVALSSAALAAPAFAAAAIDRSVRGSLAVADRIYIHSEFRVPEDSVLVSRTVSELRDDYDAHTLMIRDADGAIDWAPAPDRGFGAGDTVAIVGPVDKIEGLKMTCGLHEDLIHARAPAESVA